MLTRLDVELALQTGLTPLFRCDTLARVDGVSDDSDFPENQLPSTSSKLLRLMLSVISFASLLNHREGRTKLDPLTYTETLVSLLYRLIEFAPLGQPRAMLGGLHEDVVHLAMLAFMTTLLPKYVHEDSNRLLSDHLECAIRDFYDMSADAQDSELLLLLWTLFIGRVAILKCNDLQRMILKTCERLRLYDWLAVRHQLCVFPWIHTLHDTPGQRLWEEAQSCQDSEIRRKCLQLEV